MSSFLLSAAVVVLLTVALSLIRILSSPGDAKRMMAAQLLGTSGVAVILLFGTASGAGGMVDVALVLALLSAFASIAFVKKGLTSEIAGEVETEPAAGRRIADAGAGLEVNIP